MLTVLIVILPTMALVCSSKNGKKVTVSQESGNLLDLLDDLIEE